MLRTTKLKFSHFVESTYQGLIFASARDRDNRVHNYLVSKRTGSIREQVRTNFEPISGEYAEQIRARVDESFGVLPTFSTNYFEEVS